MSKWCYASLDALGIRYGVLDQGDDDLGFGNSRICCYAVISIVLGKSDGYRAAVTFAFHGANGSFVPRVEELCSA